MPSLADGRNRHRNDWRAFLPPVDLAWPESLQAFAVAVKSRLEALYIDPSIPGQPTSFSATAITAGTLLKWNCAQNANSHVIYISSTSTFADSTAIAVIHHRVLQYLDVAGQYPGVTTNYYWVRGLSFADLEGPLSLMVTIANP